MLEFLVFIGVLINVWGTSFLILWGITGNLEIAIIFAILSDFFAAIPTVVKAWKYPETETVLAYSAAAVSVITSLFVIKNWTFSEYAFPLYLITINISLVLIIYKKNFARWSIFNMG